MTRMKGPLSIPWTGSEPTNEHHVSRAHAWELKEVRE